MLSRFLLPWLLLAAPAISRDAVWAGTGQCAELWDKETFFAAREALKQDENRVENMTPEQIARQMLPAKTSAGYPPKVRVGRGKEEPRKRGEEASHGRTQS